MFRTIHLASLAALVVGALALAPAAGAATPTNSSALRGAVGSAGMLEHLQALQDIADANGGTRASGTSGFGASLAYVKAQLDAAGYLTTVQPFSFDYFTETAPAVFERVQPDPAAYPADDFATMSYSGSGDVTGKLFATNDIVVPPGAQASTSNSGCESGDFASAPAGEPAVALIQRGTCDFAVKARNAAAAGYDAVIIFNEGQQSPDDRYTTLFGTLGEIDPALASIPVIGTSFPVGEQLYGRLQAGQDVRVRVATSTFSETRQTANLLAETRTGRDDRVVVAGGHLDSVPEGPGINDNGSGTAALLDIALAISDLGIEPRNKLRFAFFGAEEAGLIGSQFYVDSLSARQQKRIAVMLNFDMLGSPNYGRFVYDGDASDTDSLSSTGSGVVESVFERYFAGAGLATLPTAFDGRSDYDAFISVGIPAGGLFSGAEDLKSAREAELFGGLAGVAFDACYHQACDTIDNVNADALDELGDGAAHAVLTFAQTTSAVQGTDKGKALGHGEYQGSLLRR